MPRSAVRRQSSAFFLLALSLVSTLLARPIQAEVPAPVMAPVLDVAKELQLPETDLAVASIPLDGPGKARFMNADMPLNPGSIMKVITTYAALELLGPTFQWHTRLYTDGIIEGETLNGNLYFVGSGDPKLTEERLWLLLREFCLLYTSPSPRDGLLSRMPSSA